MGRYREYMTGSKLRDPSTSSRDRKASPSQVSSSSSSDPNFLSFRRRARINARNQELQDQERMMDSRNENHKSRSIQHESYRSRSPIESRRRRKGRESSDESPAPKRRRQESREDEERYDRQYRRSSPSPIRRGERKDGHNRGRRRNSDPRSASPPTRRRESRSLSLRDSSRSSSSRYRQRPSRSHHRHHHQQKQSQRKRSRSHSPPRRRQHRSPHRPTAPPGRSHAPLPSQEDAFASKSGPHRPPRPSEPSRSQQLTTKPPSPPPPKQAPNYAPTGLLAAETNTVANTSIILKYHEPPNARLPPSSDQWRLFIFKAASHLSTLNLYERTCWLFGRERLIADCATDHPSCSKQHAVIQFRYTQVDNEEGKSVGAVRPYLIDLESANGTLLNGEMVPKQRYVELRTEDVVRFGESEREYVVLLPPRK